VLWTAEAPAAVSIRDDAGRTITLAQPAKRVIALYGAFNEILGAMGQESLIVARTQNDRLPASLAAKPSIGTHMRPNLELVLGYRPDLVLQMAGRPQADEAVKALQQYGVNTALFQVTSFDDLFSVITRLGVLVGAEDRARAMVQDMKVRLQAVAEVVRQAGPAPTVFYEVRYPNLLGAGQGSMVNEIIKKAGGVNCVDSPEKIVRLGEEELLRLSPEFYLAQQGPMNPNPVPLADRPHFQPLKAAREGRYYLVAEEEFSRPGPRNIEAVENLARLLYPARFDKNGGTTKSEIQK
jgi:iron complex transport system substrate-binding protein